MLKAIRMLPQGESLELLTYMIDRNLPSPSDSVPDDDAPAMKKLISEVESEVRRKFDRELSSRMDFQSALLSELSTQIAEITLQGRDLTPLRNSLGNRGLLKRILYKPVFQQNFEQAIGIFGIRKNHIESILAKPDIIQDVGYTVEDNIAIYLKNIETDYSISQVMVFAQRFGDTLMVHNAWRHYSDETRLNATETLRDFVDQFGLDVRMNGEVKKLFWKYRMPLVKNDRGENLLSFQIVPSNVKGFTATSNYRADVAKNEMLVSYLFAINNDKYLSSLEARKKR